MSQSIWAYFVVMMGIMSLVAVNYVGNFANNNELDYFALKEIQQSAMMDSIDYLAYREDKQFRIDEEVFVEQFTKRFASVAGLNRKYKITFNKIIENPPMTSVTIESSPNTNFVSNQSIDDLLIKNEMDAILLLDKPVVNMASSITEPPGAVIQTLYKPCPYLPNGEPDITKEGGATVVVKAIETDNLINDTMTYTTLQDNGSPSVPGKFALTAANAYTYQKQLNIIPGQNHTYLFKAHVQDWRGLSADIQESVVLNSGDKCLPVYQKPSIILDPPYDCGSDEITVKAVAVAPFMTDIYYQIAKVTGATEIDWDNTTAYPIKEVKGVRQYDIVMKQTAGYEGEYKVKVWATPEGADWNVNMSPEKIGQYTILAASGNFNVAYQIKDAGGAIWKPSTQTWWQGATDLKTAWTDNNVTFDMSSISYSIGPANQSNTDWNWWTNVKPKGASGWDGMKWYSSNRNVQDKELSDEGRRRVKITVNVPSSQVGLGCNNAKITWQPELNNSAIEVLIDKTKPNVPTVTITDENGGTASKGDNNWYTEKLNFVVDAVDPGVSTGTASGIKRYELQRKNAAGDYGKYVSGTLVEGETYDYSVADINDPEYTIGLWNDAGNRTVRIRAVDIVGHKGNWSSDITFKIDTVKPTCDNVRYGYGDSGYDGSWTKNNIWVIANCNDDTSGCVADVLDVEHKRDGALQRSPGTAVDNAGWSTACGTIIARIDQAAPSIPTVNCSNPSSCDVNAGTENITGSWSGVTDPHSGLSATGYKFIEQEFANRWSAIPALTSGASGSGKTKGIRLNTSSDSQLYAFVVYAEDNVGNIDYKPANCNYRKPVYTTVVTTTPGSCYCTNPTAPGNPTYAPYVACNSTTTQSACEAYDMTAGGTIGGVKGTWTAGTSTSDEVLTSCRWQ